MPSIANGCLERGPVVLLIDDGPAYMCVQHSDHVHVCMYTHVYIHTLESAYEECMMSTVYDMSAFVYIHVRFWTRLMRREYF
jgi:hypothetical protein